MSIGILGANDRESAQKIVKQVLVDMSYRKNIMKAQYDQIVAQGVYKKVNSVLENFIGVHDLEIASLPGWYKNFVLSLINDIIDSIPEEQKEQVESEFETMVIDSKISDTSKKLIELYQQLEQMTPQVFESGKMPNGQKILKYCKKIYEFVNPGNKDQSASREWYKTYESKKTAKDFGGLKLVITNSSATFLCMSNVFEKKEYTSCQNVSTHKPNDNYIGGIALNLLDESSLIAYVTNGNKAVPEGSVNAITEEHQVMVTRTLVRLLHDEHSNKYYIVPDRAYPHSTYTPSLVLTLKKICEELDNVEVAIFDDYTSEQKTSDENFIIPTESIIYISYDDAPVGFKQQFIWDDEDGEGYNSTHCGCSRESCHNKTESGKYNCDYCLKSGKYSVAVYHDNITDAKVSQDGKKYKRHANVKPVKLTWNKAKEGHNE